MQLPDRPPVAPRRLMRSTRDRMWAGVAGGMAEYFDIDPSLIRLIWVAAAVVTWGVAIPVYILAWIILPREDRPVSTTEVSRDWSREFHSETQRLADEARLMADDGAGQPWQATAPEVSPLENEPTADPVSERGDIQPASPSPAPEERPAAAPLTPEMPVAARAATDKGEPVSYSPTPTPAWSSLAYTEPPAPPARHHRSTGAVLVVLGIVLLAANAGWFRWIDWSVLWPLIFIGMGVVLLTRQVDWKR